MRYVNFTLLAIAAIIVITLSVANRDAVSVALWPDVTAYGLARAPEARIPLFLVALGCGAIGFVLGAAREYLREGRLRRRAAETRREVGKLQREVETLKSRQNLDEDDEIIALTSR